MSTMIPRLHVLTSLRFTFLAVALLETVTPAVRKPLDLTLLSEKLYTIRAVSGSTLRAA